MDDIWIAQDRLLICDEECVGSGGYGKVYKAFLRPEEKKVAFKQLLANVDNPRQKQRLINEALQLRNLQHDNIIKVLGVLDSDRFGLIMEFAEFGCLLDLLEDYTPLGWPLRAQLLRGVANGMVYLHAQGVLHHDLKGSNVLVQLDLQPKISDFGVSHWREAMKHSSQSQSVACSTITHIAPERLENVNFQPNAACDVYSFAILMFEVLSDETPFFGIPGDRIEKAVKSGERPALSHIPLDCPEELVRIMMKCWFHEPTARPDFVAVCASLDEHISGVEGFLGEAESEKYRLLVRSGFHSGCTPPSHRPVNALNSETRKPRIEVDSLPVNINDNMNPEYRSVGDGRTASFDNNCDGTPVNTEEAAKCNPESKQMPAADLLSGLKNLKIDPKLIKGHGGATDGGFVMIGHNCHMNITLDGKADRSKKVTIKMSDLTTSTEVVKPEACAYVAKNVGRKWRSLGRELKFADGELDALGSDFRDDMKEAIHQMLRQWQKREGRNATLHNLAVGLAKAGKGYIALNMAKYA